MTDSTTNIGNAKLAISTQPMSARRSIALESSGFAAAELASIGVSLGVVAIAEDLIPKSIMKKATDTVSKICVEPYLDTIESAIKKCHLKECQPDETKSREERAQRIARGVVIFSAAYVAALGSKLWIRDWSNKFTGVSGDNHVPVPENASWLRRKTHHLNFNNWSPDTKLVFAADELAHIGSLVYLNTRGSEFTDHNIDAMSNILKKTGMSESKAKDISTMAMVWEVPNFLGLVAGGAAITGKHAYGWPKEHKYQKFSDLVSGKAMSPYTHST